MERPAKILLKDLLPPYLPRQEYDKTEIRKLALSISKNGLEQNIGLNITPEGLKPIYGTRRLKALEYMEVETIPSPKYPILSIGDIKFYTVSEEEAWVRAIEENLRRKDMTPLEEAIALSKLSPKQLKEYSESYVTQRKNFLTKLDERLRERTVYGSHNHFEDKIKLTFAKARILWNLPSDDQWYVYRYKIRTSKGMTTKELQRYVQSIMNKRAYLDEATTDEEINQRKKEAKKLFYDIKTLSKIPLAKLKDEIEPYSLGLQRQIRKEMKRFDRANKKSFFFKICDVEGLGVLEFWISVENLVRLLKMKENDAFYLGVGSVVIRSNPIENLWIDEKDKLEPYGWTIENGKIIKKGKRTKDVDIEEFLERSPRFQLMKMIEKEEKKRKRLLREKRKEEQRSHWVKIGDKTYKVPEEELSEFNKASESGNVLVLKKYECPLSQKKLTG